ncbi:MAG: ATP-binding protein [Desulfobacterales bacterium]|nr:ATP-binding protein [Desulfobacterales bacterium]
MLTWNLAYGCLSVLSGIGSIGLAVYLLHSRQNKGARQLLFLMAASGLWSVTYGFELLSPALWLKVWWVRMEYLGVAFIGVLLLRFVLMVTGPQISVTCRRVLWGIPLLVVLSVFTNSWHQLMWADVGMVGESYVQALQFSRGPMFWVHVGYSYLMILIAFILLVRAAFTSKGPHRMQVLVMLPGIIAPWIANGIYLLEIPGLSYIDTSPMAFMVTCMFFAVGLFRYHLVNLIPLAHEAVMDGLGDPVVVMDTDDHVVEINAACARTFGLAHPYGPRRPADTCLPGLYGIVSRRRRRDTPVSFDASLEMPGGGLRDWHMRISPVWGRRDRQSGWLVVIRDITEQKEAETRLRDAGNYMDSIINAMPSAIIGVDRDGGVTHWNEGAKSLTGLDDTSACGKKLVAAIAQMAPYLTNVMRAIETGMPQRLEKQVLNFGPVPDSPDIESGMSEGVTYDITIFPVVSGTRPGAVIRIDDVSDQVRIQEMMVQSEKMMSVGGLAAGMAHEINNPLAGMIQNIQVIRNRLSTHMPANLQAAERHGMDIDRLRAYMTDRKIFHMMDQATHAGERAAKIVENMLSFNRREKGGGRSSHRLPDMVETTLAVLENDYNLRKHYDFKSVKVVGDGGADQPPIPCEKSEIQQVLFNIFKNGTEAMAIGGTEAPQFTIRYFIERGMVGVEIRNNGPGFSEDVRKRLFEPFFTTKPVGMGTGLGLSVSYFIVVENHGGELTAVSRPGEGAGFTVKLPTQERIE